MITPRVPIVRLAMRATCFAALVVLAISFAADAFSAGGGTLMQEGFSKNSLSKDNLSKNNLGADSL
jgi:hypothetical protein